MNPAFRGNCPRSTGQLLQWHGRVPREAALEPEMPIVDAHHHLYGKVSDPQYYRMEDLSADLAGGHAVIGTVYVEGYHSGWCDGGPEPLRPVAEVEVIVDATAVSPMLAYGPCRVAAGIVSYADLRVGDAVARVIDSQLNASQGRLRGVRYQTAWDGGTVGSTLSHLPPRDVMNDAGFRRGVASVQRFGLSLDVWVYHHQLRDLVALVDAFPDLCIVVNHVGGLIGVAEHRPRHASAYACWVRDLKVLAARPNVRIKVGGLGMPVFGFGFEHEERPATSTELALAWQPFVDACVEVFGTRRCLFETNAPTDKQSAGYVEIWNAYKRTTRQLSAEERRDLFYRTACDTYRLPELKSKGDAMPVGR